MAHQGSQGTPAAAAPPSQTPATSPGQMTPLERKEDVLARLVCGTTDDTVKKVIRLYKAGDTYKRQFNAIKSKSKADDLVATLKYFNEDALSNKEDNIKLLILKIQSLFPDHCKMCNEDYAIHRTEVPLLRCAKCDQGIHARCLAQKLGIAEVALETMSAEEVMNKVNPLGMPTMPYLCGFCFDALIPPPDSPKTEEVKNKTKAKSKHIQRLIAESENIDETSESEAEPETNPIENGQKSDDEGNVADSESESDDESVTEADARPKSNTKQKKNEPKNQTKPICSFYRKGTCRYGISGKGCPRAHPKLCSKLMTCGDKAPRGCRKGSNCEKFHPKMCQSSLLHRECLDDSCTAYHVKGTRRTNSRPKEQSKPNRFQNREMNNHRNAVDSSKTTTADSMNSAPHAFLEALNSWTKQFMATLDQKLLQGGQTQHLQQTYSNPQQTYSNPQLVPAAGPPQAILLPQAQILHQGLQGVPPPRQ